MEIGATAAPTPSPATDRPATDADEGPAISSDFETFLRMLTTQMENQDPLNPMKSEEFAVQLATFSGVEQQVQTNDLLESLSRQLGATNLSSLASWVGMDVRAPVPVAFDGAPVPLTLAPSDAARRELIVKDGSGAEVQRLAIPTGETELDWAGVGNDGSPLPHGAYSFEVAEYEGGTVVASAPASVYARVVEARPEGGSTVLVTETGATVAATEVSALRAGESDAAGA